jgi:carboxypeptidase family protein
MRIKHFLLLPLTLALLSISAFAQPGTATVKGVLTDDSGAVIPAADVSLVSNGSTKTAQSQADGSYTFSGLTPGQYTVSISFPGFSPFSKTITVSAGGAVQVPIQLAIRAEKQEVTVQEQATTTVSVEPDNNATALVIKDSDLESLPDDPDDLSSALQALAGPGAGPNGGQIYIDGFSGGQLPPKESIREIRINQNPFSAEYDRLGFGRIEILTKPGTDKLRGAIGFNDSDGIFNSRNPFSNNKPDYSSRMWNGNLGGSLSKKASFFLDFNRRDVQDNSVIVAQYFDPKLLTESSINSAVLSPSSFTILSPRIDYQLSTNHTLTVRFEERMNSKDNAGLGGTRLPAPYSQLGYNMTGDGQNLMVTESAVLSPRVVNETRFQLYRSWTDSPGNLIPQINVAGSFVTGGNGMGATHDLSRHYELTNNTSISHGAHTIRFGARGRRDGDQSNNPAGFNGSFTFLGGVAPLLNAQNQVVLDSNGNPQTVTLTSLQQYERTVLLMQAGFAGAQLQALGGGPSRFNIQAGQSYISADRWDFAPFVQDDWRIRPNLTLSLGLRYEVQTLVSDYKDWAPRIGFAWAPGNPKNGRQKTVVRGGFGMFYDRIGTGLFETAALNNGINQLQYTVYNPTFYPNIPSLASLSAGQNSISRVDPNLRADYSIQSAIGVERQLPRNTTVAVTYTFNRAVHLSQSVPVNTPLPGTFNPALPLSAANGIFPYGYSAGNIFETESGGYMRQNMVMANFNTRFSNKVSLFGNYSLGYAKDLPGSPTNPYDFAMDYGRSNFDRRHNLMLIGNVIGPKDIRLAPFVTVRSGQPYDVLLGEDIYGDTLTNARADFASQATCSSVIRSVSSVCSPFGTFSTLAYSATGAGSLVPRNYLTMPGIVSVNLRLYRTWGFGGSKKAAQDQMGGGMPSAGVMGLASGGRGGPGGPGGHGPGGPGMGGPMGMMGGGSSEHPYNLTLSVSAENVLNHLNPGGYMGTITSPYFLQATSVNTGFGGGGPGGMAGAANNRRITLGLRFTF